MLIQQGKEHIEFRKAWTGDKLDMIMANFNEEAPKGTNMKMQSRIDDRLYTRRR